MHLHSLSTKFIFARSMVLLKPSRTEMLSNYYLVMKDQRRDEDSQTKRTVKYPSTLKTNNNLR